MEYLQHRHDNGAEIRAARFAGDPATEIHLTVIPGDAPNAAVQLERLTIAYHDALSAWQINPTTAVFRRLFLSDYANQFELAKQSSLAEGVALSLIEQPPLPPRKFALWAYHILDGAPTEAITDGAGLALPRGALTHVWTTGLSSAAAGADEQTQRIFVRYEEILDGFGATLADHALRTWVFVRDIDCNYTNMVNARRELFAERGLTEQTHFIASTGIAGATADPHQLVSFDAYAVAGIDPRQIRYLNAPDNLGPTSRYGVTFERGAAVDYGDRRHVLISGTASIDNQGQIMHEGDIAGQVERTVANIEALLADAEAGLDDVAYLIVYLRDAADRLPVANYLDRRTGQVPRVIVHAPVCRPGWLVEIEAAAVVAKRNETWQPF